MAESGPSSSKCGGAFESSAIKKPTSSYILFRKAIEMLSKTLPTHTIESLWEF